MTRHWQSIVGGALAGHNQKKTVANICLHEKLFRENECGQEARRQQLITSVWLFHATLFDFDFEGHGKLGLLTQKVFWVRKFAKNRKYVMT